MVHSIFRDPQKKIRAAQPGFELQSLLEICNRLFVATLLFPNQAEVQICFGKSWRLLDDGGKTVSRLLEVSLPHGLGSLLELPRDTCRHRRLCLARESSEGKNES